MRSIVCLNILVLIFSFKAISASNFDIISRNYQQVIPKEKVNFEITENDLLQMSEHQKMLISFRFDKYKKLQNSSPDMMLIFEHLKEFSDAASVNGSRLNLKGTSVILSKTAMIFDLPIAKFSRKLIFDQSLMKNLSGIDKIEKLKVYSHWLHGDNYASYKVFEYITGIGEFSSSMKMEHLNSTEAFEDYRVMKFDSRFDQSFRGDLFMSQGASDFFIMVQGIYNICKYKDMGSNKTLGICYFAISVGDNPIYRLVYNKIEKKYINTLISNMLNTENILKNYHEKTNK